MSEQEQKSQFENTRGGYVGIVKVNMKGEPEGAAVGPGETVWLTEREQALTAEAPRHEADNPFTNGSLTLRVRSSDVPSVRPIGDDQDVQAPPAAPEQPGEEMEEIRVEQPGAEDPDLKPEETAAVPAPQGEAPEGSREANEEVATPEAARADEKPEVAEDTSAEREAGHRPSASPLAPGAAEPAPTTPKTRSTE